MFNSRLLKFEVLKENYEATGQLLTESLGFEEIGQEYNRFLYQSEPALRHTNEIIDGLSLDGKPGKGTIHHIAFRTADVTDLETQRVALAKIGYHLTEIEDRYYFNSIFFHEPEGALVEMATDGRGFSIDEDAESLGQMLSLPPQLEEKRSLIEEKLPAIVYCRFL